MSTQKTADDKPKRGWWPFGGSSAGEDEDGERETSVTTRKGRATPGRRTTETHEGNAVTRVLSGTREYFEGVASELQKVTWPTREEAIRLSTIVLVATFLSSVILGLVALGYSELFQVGLSQPLVFLGFFVLVVVIGFILYRRSNRSHVSPY